MEKEITKLIEKFNKLNKTDFEKLQIHVIFDYMSINSNDSSSFTPEDISEIVQNKTNCFNFSFIDKPEHILEKNITKLELETLLPELNKEIVRSKVTSNFATNLINSSAIPIAKDKVYDKTTIMNENAKNLGFNPNKFGGTRITKRQKKTPPKRNKHHTAKNQT